MANCSWGFGKRGEPILITQLGGKFYWAKKGVPVETASLFLERKFVYKLSPGHVEYLKQGLHFDMRAFLLEQWIWHIVSNTNNIKVSAICSIFCFRIVLELFRETYIQ